MRECIPSKTKKLLVQRSKKICEVCRVNPAEEIHHIVPVVYGGKNNIENLCYLCEFCHDYVPGDQPDGFHEEFDIYKENGGVFWGIFASGFVAGYESAKEGTKDALKFHKPLTKLVNSYKRYLKENSLRIPFPPGMCYQVFK